jgi:hypothetical protein
MSVGVETGDFIGVPVPAGIERPDPEALFRFRYLKNDRVEVHHPFHGTTIIGSGEAFGSLGMDAAAVVLFTHMPYLADSMKLNRTRKFETRLFAGEYPESSHLFSLGSLAVDWGGGPMDLLDALFNDASKLYNGHQGDDNYQGHGAEDLHDRERALFFERAGIIDALSDAGTLRREISGIYVGKSRLSIERLLSEEEVTIRASFLSNKNPARRMDGDRFQYNNEESFLVRWSANRHMPEPGRIAVALADLSLNSVTRRIVLEGGEGDQLVYIDDQPAFSDAVEYVRHNTEHWTEPVQDVVNDILNLAERYLFICNNPHARQFQYFYPRDYLHTSASFMNEQFEEVAKDDRVMRWFLDTAAYIAADQREKNLKYQNGSSYEGPKPPEGLVLEKLDCEPNPEGFNVINQEFVIDLPKGKVRNINPRVINGGSTTKPLSEIRPDFVEFQKGHQRWIGNYRARIKIEDRDLAEEVKAALDRIRDKWGQALTRPLMPPGELQRNINQANEYVKAAGKIDLSYKPTQ